MLLAFAEWSRGCESLPNRYAGIKVVFIHHLHQPFRLSSQILSRGRQQELIVCLSESRKSQLIQLHHALEMDKQHLDFLRSLYDYS